MGTCPSDNTQETDQSSFWSPNGLHWDAHRIGWAISGGCALLTIIISIFSVLGHCRNYTVPAEQRQIIRILYMPPVYAIISFFSYRYFRSYTYYELIEVIYEAVTLSAFMLLIIEYVASTASNHSAAAALARKDKRSLPIPLCCWRYRPTKAYFMYTMKWLVLQYVVIRPLVSIAGIICQAFNVLCEDEGLMHFQYAYVYITIVDFISITVSLYGLLMFYGLTKDELKDKRPLAKFLCIKLIVMFTFYQSFVFELLEGKVIKGTAYWTETNIANGLTALTICIEMVFFALAMMWSYPATPYKRDGKRTSIGRPLWDSINFSDFAAEIWDSLKFFVDYMRGKPETHTSKSKANFGQAFGVEGASTYKAGVASGYVPSPRTGMSNFGPGNMAGDYESDLGASPQERKHNYRVADDSAGGGGRGASIDQYGEDVRLTTFSPRNGGASVYGNGSPRASDDMTADGTYPQAPYPPPSQHGTGRRPY